MPRGMHHKPSQVGRRVAQTAGTGIAAVGLFTATDLLTPDAASAAERVTRASYLALADCESGDRKNGVPVAGTARWDINDDSGFDGGVQFDPDTWTSITRGEGLPQFAYQATPDQQIAMADKLLVAVTKEKGGDVAAAWASQFPDCSDRMNLRGLVPGLEAADVPVDDEAPAPTPPPVDEGETQEEAQEQLDEAQDPPEVAQPPVPVTGDVEVSFEHVVKRGEWLSTIAQDRGICAPGENIATCWEDFANQNQAIVPDPWRIFPGQVLTYRGLALANAPVVVADDKPAPEGDNPAVAEEDAPAVAEPASEPEVVEEAAEDAPRVTGRFVNPNPNAPLPGSSNFGAPRDGGARKHMGLDTDCTMNQDILFATDAVVTFAGTQGGYGKVVYAVAADGTETRYAHLNQIDVEKGDVVLAGDRVGGCGNTGPSVAGPNGDGTHLHFEVRPKGGNAIDPLPWLRERV